MAQNVQFQPYVVYFCYEHGKYQNVHACATCVGYCGIKFFLPCNLIKWQHHIVNLFIINCDATWIPILTCKFIYSLTDVVMFIANI